MKTEGPFEYVPIQPMIEIALMNCMQQAVCAAIAELCQREAIRLDRELMCMIGDKTLPRTWGNPEAFHKC